ncbi:hypothetical protein HPB50_008432 [Hyalomma asiaticum]|uniref:Uncharacterized protein n=1 Tax=Hyalomma asiaticum TaxID=266040 RepID=A0ACB7TB34_HYAAI|nr:hypothetical protein HPB50_008432 [Hyalomma asiaticum]
MHYTNNSVIAHFANLKMPSTSTICRSTQCTLIERWLERLLAAQTDPCETTHRFTCSEDAHYPGKQYSYLEVPPKSQIIKEASKHTSEAQAINQNAGGDRNSSFDLCLQYARDAHSGARDISQFLASVGLDLGSIDEDPSYDILSRMLELSLIDLHADVRNFLASWSAVGKEEWRKFYIFCLQSYTSITPGVGIEEIVKDVIEEDRKASWSAVGKEEWRKFYIFCLQSYTSITPGVGIEEIVKDIIEEDRKGANILSMTRNSKTFTRMTVANLSQRTGVESDRWTKLLALHGRLDLLPEDTVTATEQALLLLHHLATHVRQRVARRFVAWHLLRHFIAVKENVLRAFNAGPKDAGYAPSSTIKCQRIIEGLNYGPIAAVELLTGVMEFLNHVQSTLTSVFHERQGSHYRKPPNLPTSRLSSQSFDADRRYIDGVFRGLRVVKQPFLRYWLLVLRSWNALPPLMQAHLHLVVASGVPVNTVASYFEPPYYYDDGIAAYNFAALGQVISEALAVKLVEEFSRNAFFRDRWQHFWARNHITGYSAAYCLHDTSNTVGQHLTRYIAGLFGSAGNDGDRDASTAAPLHPALGERQEEKELRWEVSSVTVNRGIARMSTRTATGPDGSFGTPGEMSPPTGQGEACRLAVEQPCWQLNPEGLAPGSDNADPKTGWRGGPAAKLYHGH